MNIPQEIIDEVIDNLAFDFTTLKSTSLVSKSWTHRSRRRLFYFVAINSLRWLERWSLSISSDPEGVASYPRTLTLLSYHIPRAWLEPENLDKFYHHFRSFSRVEHLVISGFDATKFDATSTPHYFGNFTATVRSLELRSAAGTVASLFSFICAFPLLDDLVIEFPNITGGSGKNGGAMDLASVPSFRGKLKLLDRFHGSNPLVELLCALPLPFHTISISSRDPGRLPQLAKLVSKCGKTLRSLHIARKTYGMTSRYPSLFCLLKILYRESIEAIRRFPDFVRGPRGASHHGYLPEPSHHYAGGDPPYTAKDGQPLTNCSRRGQ